MARKEKQDAGGGRATGRRPVFRAWVGITIVMAVAIAVFAPLIESAGNTTRWVAILAAGMAALLFLGVGWLLVFVLSGGRGRS